MMITPIGFNTIYNTHDIQKKNTNGITFSGLKLEDFFDGSHEIFNNAIINNHVIDGDFEGALKAIKKAGNRYDPNYYDEKTNALLLTNVCYPKTLKAKIKSALSSNYGRYRSLLIEEITSHPKFNPNKPIPSKSLKAPNTTYIEQAIEYNDAELVAQLCEIESLKDPFNNEFLELQAKAYSNPYIQHILEKTRIERGFKDALEKASTKVGTSEDNFFEDDAVKKFRADILDSVPATINDVGGLKKAKTVIEDFIIKPWSSDLKNELLENNIDMPNGILMYGPPGCGKTYIAKVIAKQTGFPMYEVDLSNVGSSAGYKTSNTLREIFTALESQYRKNNIPNILFLDEIDSIAASRETSGTDWKRDDINTLISLLNNAAEKGIIVIGATNILDNVDKAVLRTGRFDKKIEISLPTEEERKDILEKVIGMKKIAISLLPHLDKLAEATDGKSCSDISAIVNDCCRRAIYQKKKRVTVKDFENSIRIIEENSKKERPKIGF